MPEAPADLSAPATWRVAVSVLAAEAVVLLGLTGWVVYQDFFAAATSPQGALGTTIFALALAALLGLLAWSIWKRRAWARGPAVVLQLLLLPIGYYMITGGQPLLGVVTIAVGLVGAGALLAHGTRAALDIPEQR